MWEDNLTLTNQNTESMMILVHEWRSTSRHLVDEDAECPPIHSKSMTLHIQNLRSQILSSSAERLGSLIWLKEFGEAKISQLNVALFIYEHIFWLQVSMNDFICVQVTQSEQNLCSDEFDLRFREPLLDAEMIENVSSLDIL